MSLLQCMYYGNVARSKKVHSTNGRTCDLFESPRAFYTSLPGSYLFVAALVLAQSAYRKSIMTLFPGGPFVSRRRRRRDGNATKGVAQEVAIINTEQNLLTTPWKQGSRMTPAFELGRDLPSSADKGPWLRVLLLLLLLLRPASPKPQVGGGGPVSRGHPGGGGRPVGGGGGHGRSEAAVPEHGHCCDRGESVILLVGSGRQHHLSVNPRGVRHKIGGGARSQDDFPISPHPSRSLSSDWPAAAAARATADRTDRLAASPPPPSWRKLRPSPPMGRSGRDRPPAERRKGVCVCARDRGPRLGRERASEGARGRRTPKGGGVGRASAKICAFSFLGAPLFGGRQRPS